MPIRILSEQLASQIAAGEVVERPASVVKELVENAIDAGATTINVDIRNGGRALIQVADNGSGIAADEVETAFRRHATSKLESAAALAAISTLGFRGEALAAIASVSVVTVVTRGADGAAGVRLTLEGGAVLSRETVGAPQGTVVAVENLFFNTPARLKFLKSVNSERRAVDEFLTRYALAYPNIRFRLTHNGRVTFQSDGNGDVRDVLLAVYGVELGRDWLAVAPEGDAPAGEAWATPHDDIHVSGYVSPPGIHRSNRSQISLYVNGRWVRDQRLTYAVIEAYHTLLPVGRYPLAVLFIALPYADVDVNVHPMKSEVRFRQPGKLFSAVQRAVRAALLATAPVRRAGSGPFETLTAPTLGRSGVAWDYWGRQPALDLPAPVAPAVTLTGADQTDDDEAADAPFAPNSDAPARTLGGSRLPIMRVIGQVGRAYIITEGPAGLYLIDQHAAHERILYEQWLAAAGDGPVASQALIDGLPVDVAPDQVVLLEANLALLARLGFGVEPFGPHTFIVRAVPALLARSDPARALRDVVEELEVEQRPLAGAREAAIVRRVCKTAAIKAGQLLSPAESEALVRQLEACETPHTCPHGRPTLIHLSVNQLAREFGRT